MKKIIFSFLFIFLNYLNAQDTKIYTFDKKYKILEGIKLAVLYEEALAKAFEQSLINELSTKPSIVDLDYEYLEQYIHNNPPLKIDTENAKFTGLRMTALEISLTDDFKNSEFLDTYINSMFRERTFVVKNDNFQSGYIVNFKLKDKFAKHVFLILQTNGLNSIAECQVDPLNPTGTTSSIICKKNDHIYFYLNISKVGTEFVTSYLMYYHKNNFEKGPIIITDNKDSYLEENFKVFPVGTIFYDSKGVKYIKTINSIQEVK